MQKGNQCSSSEKKKDGKCWKCRENFSLGRKCNTQTPYNCEAEQEEDTLSSESDEDTNKENEALSSEPEEEAMPRISLVTITGIAKLQTRKLKGHIKKKMSLY